VNELTPEQKFRKTTSSAFDVEDLTRDKLGGREEDQKIFANACLAGIQTKT